MEMPEEWKAHIKRRTREGMARAKAAGKRIGREPTGGVTVEAIQRLRSQGLSMDYIARTLGIGKGVSQRVCQEFDARAKTEELTEPPPEGYLIPGETDQKWSNKVNTHQLSAANYAPKGPTSRSFCLYIGQDLATDPKNAISVGEYYFIRAVELEDRVELRTKRNDNPRPRDGSVVVSLQDDSPDRSARIQKCLSVESLDCFRMIRTPTYWDDATGEHVFIVMRDKAKAHPHIALNRKSSQQEAEAQPEAATMDPATGVLMPPAAAPDAWFRAAVDAILKAGQDQNRRHFFLAEDGVTKVWVDGSSLGYEQIKPLTLSTPEMGQWLADKGATNLVVELLKCSQGDMSLDMWAEWLVVHKRLDLAKAALEEMK